jgi:6-phosphogluconolactonase (cycloisomerase 2 family)
MTMAAVLALTGCREFFVPVNGGGGSTTGDYVYVANQTTATLAGYSISTSGKLSSVTNSPYSLGYIPTALAVTPGNAYLYVGSLFGLYVYSINSDGSLTAAVGGASQASVLAQSMAISPDGNWLFVLNAFTVIAGAAATGTISEFAINSTTGALTPEAGTSFIVSSTSPSAQDIVVSPNGNFVIAALGTGGDVVFPFNTSTGAFGNTYQNLSPPSSTSDNALAVGPNSDYLYIARSGVSGSSGLAVYSITASNGALTQVSGSPYTTGNGPYSVAFANTGNYLYVGNRTDNTISGFSVASGKLTALSGSPYTTGAQPIGIVKDRTGAYMLVACAGGSPDLQLFGFDSSVVGKLTSISSTATGTDPTNPIAIAATH